MTVNVTQQRRVPHAIQRAYERYGIKLSSDDLRQIAIACAEGKGCLSKYRRDGTERHAVMVHGRALVIVYRPRLEAADLSHPHRGAGSVITILPQEAALAGNQGSIATKFKRGSGQKKKPSRATRARRGY